MKKTIFSPFYTINSKNELKYLDKYKICKLPSEKEIMKEILKKEGVLLSCYKNKKYDNTVLVLEPHSDDFALSALAYCIDKYSVEVLNVFSKTTLKYFPWIDKIKLTSNEYENLRLCESNLVIEKILNQKFISLREESVRITNKKLEDIEKQIINSIEKLLKTNQSIDTILVPMGIGNHPDHIIVYNAIMNNYSKFNNYKIILYPEYPYARCKKSYIERFNKISNTYKLNSLLIPIEDKVDIIADCISAYKSQFDDINRDQMLAIIKEDSWAISQEYEIDKLSLVYFEVGDVKNEN